MIHPAIQAVLNMRKELNARLARIGQTAVQELLQPLFSSDSPISAIQWSQAEDGTTGAFFSTHRVPSVLVDKAQSATEYDKGQFVDPSRVIGVLGAGWATPKQLIPATRRLFEEKIKDFASIPNDIMQLTFGNGVTVTIASDGRITTEPS
jgi:hypothetical protein